MAKLFGTDGIRGVAGEPPLDAATVFAVGRALGEFLREQKAAGKVLLGEDTRESSPWVTRYLAGGLRAAGVEGISAGVLPTPAIARLVRARGFAAGAMVSASHNPYRDNGVKLIAANGMKLPDETEAQLAARIQALRGAGGEPPGVSPPVDMSLAGDYLEALRQATPANLWEDFQGLHLVVDCANGAASGVAPKLFRSLGAGVTALHAAPDGKNINAGCGALHPESLAAKVTEVRAHLGVAFDGDADRAIFVAGSGRIVNGDGVLLACARWMREKKLLRGGCVVGTVMANLGLEVALKAEGLPLLRTAVGDRYVLEEMLARGANLGGEQSGHIIFLDDSPAGDGLLTTLKVLTILAERDATLDDLVADLKVFPQTLKNTRVREKRPLEELPAVTKAIREATAALGPRGRVIVRYSGTEPLLRVMVEAETEADVQRWTDHISRAVESSLGG
jgi:phosphoglucosamine mutase